MRLLIPEGGLSGIDAPGQPFWDPEADRALSEARARLSSIDVGDVEIRRNTVVGALLAVAADARFGTARRAVLEPDGAPIGADAGLLAHTGAACCEERNDTERQQARGGHNGVLETLVARSIEMSRARAADPSHTRAEDS